MLSSFPSGNIILSLAPKAMSVEPKTILAAMSEEDRSLAADLYAVSVPVTGACWISQVDRHGTH